MGIYDIIAAMGIDDIKVKDVEEEVDNLGGITPYNPASEIDPITRAKFSSVARKVLQGVTKVPVLAAQERISERSMRRWLKDPRFQLIFEEALTTVEEDIDGLIKDEKASYVLRASALRKRGLTMLGSVMKAVEEHIFLVGEGQAKASTLRAGIEAAKSALSAGHDASHLMGQTVPTENLNINADTVVLMKDTIIEAGVDLSDVIDVTPHAETKEDPGDNGSDAVGGSSGAGGLVIDASPQDREEGDVEAPPSA